jgi:hypothetical protein
MMIALPEFSAVVGKTASLWDFSCNSLVFIMKQSLGYMSIPPGIMYAAEITVVLEKYAKEAAAVRQPLVKERNVII